MKNNNGFIKRLRRGVVNLLVMTLIISHISPIGVIAYASEDQFSKEKVELEATIQEEVSESQIEIENQTEEKIEELITKGETEEAVEQETAEKMTQEEMERETTEEMTQEEMEQETAEEIAQEEMEQETTEETTQEEMEKETVEETTQEIEEQITEVMAEEAGYVRLMLHAQGGECEWNEIFVDVSTKEANLPECYKESFVFEGWYLDEACTIPFCIDELYWIHGFSYDLFAAYKEKEELVLEQKVMNMVANGVLITVSGMLPLDAALQVEVTPIAQEVKQDIVRISDTVETIEDFETMRLLYSYDITVLHEGKEYEPYENGETLEVRFTCMNRNVLSDLEEIEVFHVSEQKGLEEIEVTEVSDYEVVIRANEFSQYIVIGQVEYQSQTYWELEYQENVQNFTAPAKGVYRIDLYGAQGTDYGSYVGGKGGKVSVSVELEKGQSISVLTGGQNGFQGGVYGTLSNGGGATALLVNDEMIAIAGGGGGAGLACDGGNGGEQTQVSEPQVLSEDMMITAGGGGGYQTGTNGYVMYHKHIGDAQQGGGCYTQTSYVYHNHEDSACTYKIERCQSTDYLTLGWWPQVQGEADSEHVMCRSCGQQHIGPRAGRKPFDRTQKCGRILKEAWSCGKTENSIDAVEFALGCNKDDSFVESVVMSLGGSNYYQSQVCKNVATAIGVNEGNGRASITLMEIDAATIFYYESASKLLTSVSVEKGTMTAYPVTVIPQKAADSKYAYAFIGWDDMATQELEVLQAQETVQHAVLQDRSYLAVYDKIPQKYSLTFEQENADEVGTQQVVVQYGISLPTISIPQKKDYIFAGYYTEKQGRGIRIYREDGTGEAISHFEQDAVLYAHWIEPLEIAQHPLDVTVQAGYQFAVMEVEAILTHTSGYGMTYQWYMCNQNDEKSRNAIDGAVGKRFQVPTGYPVGTYDVYCEITVTSAYNGQKIMKKTQTAQLEVEKGVLLPNQIALKTEKVVYDGKEHTTEIVMNVQSDLKVYYSTVPMTKDNYKTSGTLTPLSYVDAGIYPVYVYLTGANYQDCMGKVTLTIEKATPTIYLANRNVAYNKKQQGIGNAKVCGVNQVLLNPIVEYKYYVDEACTELTSRENGALQEGGQPSKIGTYYVQAFAKEMTNYTNAMLKQPAMFNIIATKTKFNVLGYHGAYDGKAHGIQIEMDNEDAIEFWFSDKVELNKDNYQAEGTTNSYTYTNPGKYTVYYVAITKITGWIYDYTSGCATIVIEKASHNNGGNGYDKENQGENKPPVQNDINNPLEDMIIPSPELPLQPQLPNELGGQTSENDKDLSKKNPILQQTTTEKENTKIQETMQSLKDVDKNELEAMATLIEEREKENVLLMMMDFVDELTPQEMELLHEYLHEMYPFIQEQQEDEQSADIEKRENVSTVISFVLGTLFGMGIMFAIYPQVHLFFMKRCFVKGVCIDKAKNMPLFLETSKGVQKIEKKKNGTFSIVRLQKGETYLLKGTIKNGKTMVLMKIQPQMWNIHYECTEIAGLQIQVKERGGGLKIQVR